MTACLIGLSGNKSGPPQLFCDVGNSAKPQGDMKSLECLGTHGNATAWWNNLFKEMSMLSFVNFIKIKNVFSIPLNAICATIYAIFPRSTLGDREYFVDQADLLEAKATCLGWIFIILYPQFLVKHPSLVFGSHACGKKNALISRRGPGPSLRDYPRTSPWLRFPFIHPFPSPHEPPCPCTSWPEKLFRNDGSDSETGSQTGPLGKVIYTIQSYLVFYEIQRNILIKVLQQVEQRHLDIWQVLTECLLYVSSILGTGNWAMHRLNSLSSGVHISVERVWGDFRCRMINSPHMGMNQRCHKIWCMNFPVSMSLASTGPPGASYRVYLWCDLTASFSGTQPTN